MELRTSYQTTLVVLVVVAILNIISFAGTQNGWFYCWFSSSSSREMWIGWRYYETSWSSQLYSVSNMKPRVSDAANLAGAIAILSFVFALGCIAGMLMVINNKIEQPKHKVLIMRVVGIGALAAGVLLMIGSVNCIVQFGKEAKDSFYFSPQRSIISCWVAMVFWWFTTGLYMLSIRNKLALEAAEPQQVQFQPKPDQSQALPQGYPQGYPQAQPQPQTYPQAQPQAYPQTNHQYYPQGYPQGYPPAHPQAQAYGGYPPQQVSSGFPQAYQAYPQSAGYPPQAVAQPGAMILAKDDKQQPAGSYEGKH